MTQACTCLTSQTMHLPLSCTVAAQLLCMHALHAACSARMICMLCTQREEREWYYSLLCISLHVCNLVSVAAVL